MNKSFDSQNVFFKFGIKRSIKQYIKKVRDDNLEKERLTIIRQNKSNVEAEKNETQQKYAQYYQQISTVIRAMPRYATWRREVLKKHGNVCAKCGTSEHIEVDHYPTSMYQLVKMAKFDPLANEQEITDKAYEFTPLWDTNNGAPLCKSCHDRTTSSQTYFTLKMNT
jgi:hypothetical protein